MNVGIAHRNNLYAFMGVLATMLCIFAALAAFSR
jgi:hypothetical protein